MTSQITKKSKISVPQIVVDEVVLNENNPFKKTRNWNRLRCKLCGQTVLGRLVTSDADWNKIRNHLKIRHNIEEDEGIPIRLFSTPLFRAWLKLQRGKGKNEF